MAQVIAMVRAVRAGTAITAMSLSCFGRVNARQGARHDRHRVHLAVAEAVGQTVLLGRSEEKFRRRIVRMGKCRLTPRSQRRVMEAIKEDDNVSLQDKASLCPIWDPPAFVDGCKGRPWFRGIVVYHLSMKTLGTMRSARHMTFAYFP